jgi:MHS family proline/betaine transporter-like MFS transporter
VAIFGGTTPFIVQGLIEGTGDDMMPAYYLMATSIVGAIAIYFLRESAQRPLPGSMPSVDTAAEARELVATQDTNPLINLDEMPFDGQPIDDEVFGRPDKDLAPASGTLACNF